MMEEAISVLDYAAYGIDQDPRTGTDLIVCSNSCQFLQFRDEAKA